MTRGCGGSCCRGEREFDADPVDVAQLRAVIVAATGVDPVGDPTFDLRAGVCEHCGRAGAVATVIVDDEGEEESTRCADCVSGANYCGSPYCDRPISPDQPFCSIACRLEWAEWMRGQ